LVVSARVKRIKVIVNPYSGRWKAQAAIPAIEDNLHKLGVAFDLAVMDAPGQGIELTRQAAGEGYDVVVAAGGDGAISEVVNGLILAVGASPGAVAGPLGIVPLGSANDLADALGLSHDVAEACRCIHAGRSRAIDVGWVNGRYFDNNSAVGLEPMVTLCQSHMKRVKGTPRYVLAALLTILRHRDWQVTAEWDDGCFSGLAALVSVGNSPRTGGAFYMTPRAELDDGRLDFILGGGMSRLRLLRLLPKTFDGRHVDEPEITYRRTTRLTVTCQPATPIQADGELFDMAATRIEYRVLPGKLRVIV
jgi:YegS/Rv2252/BmrU family lipid kinase